ncbi:hypothetical protein H6S82_09695 [Planktothrix sp. FACHB-1355]|uniref:Uncharacterized protein n=1 Tax=Aerosakkonema funiforme FACHB-1375 TaxID=2949571 RepID=A0A926VA91_9CYAN|nr:MULTISPECIES: hypothetical protein [Oscillatoriales]MBD2180071.1 hypothetical protein [Aerosakkonema funiforme FACHB-1375]MBD3559131.1 hypothetical protein [Planktothrix sp. FACHB-1355]
MKVLSGFDEVVQYLQQHENSTRIKKLIFGACHNVWENDLNKLQNFTFQDLLKKLFEANPTPENLKLTLDKVVKTLNKPGEYSVIATIIFEKVSKLYSNIEEPTQVVSSGSKSPALAVQPIAQKQPDVATKSQVNQTVPPYDRFNVRMEIMKYTNPFRAKVLIFSTLYHQLSFSEQDLVTIRSYEFDDLLFNLYAFCETVRELEARLSSTARCLFEPEENSQAASAIIQTLKPFYTNRVPGMYKVKILENVMSVETQAGIDRGQLMNVTESHLNDENDNTYQVRQL